MDQARFPLNRTELAAGALLLAALWLFGWIEVAGIIAVAVLWVVASYWRATARQRVERARDLQDAGKKSHAGVEAIAVAALDRIPDPLLVLNGDGRVATANPAAAELFGKALSGRHISAVIRNPTVLEAVLEVLNGTARRAVDYEEKVPVERAMRAYAIGFHLERSDNGSNAKAERHVLIGIRDLTDMKRAEQTRADFVAHASHELRTPLSSLAGFIETLRGHAKEDDSAREQFLEIMQQQAERMGRLIQDLLSLSRIEMNEHVLPEASVDLAGVVNDVADSLAQMANDAGTTLQLSVNGEPQHRIPNNAVDLVIGDRDELVQIVQNLVDNAIKYGRRGGTVHIDLGTADSALDAKVDAAGYSIRRAAFPATGASYVSVRDEGDGIPRDQLPRLTERFYRIDVKRSRESGGTGLGLAIVKHIVNRHRGWLTIESESGRGSTFTVYVPRRPKSDDSPALNPQKQPEHV